MQGIAGASTRSPAGQRNPRRSRSVQAARRRGPALARQFAPSGPNRTWLEVLGGTQRAQAGIYASRRAERDQARRTARFNESRAYFQRLRTMLSRSLIAARQRGRSRGFVRRTV